MSYFVSSVFLMFIVVAGVVSTPAAILSPAATLTVTKTADTNDGVCDADCSLREAVAAAAPGDTIQFATPQFVSPQTVTVNGQIVINKNLIINGRGAKLTTIRNVAPAGPTSRVFAIIAASVTLSGLTITGGNLTGSSDCFGNRACGGGVISSGSLTILASHITANRAINNGGEARGGGIFASGQLVIDAGTLSDNIAAAGTNAVGGGIYVEGSPMYLSNVTISGNRASGQTSGRGGGIAYGLLNSFIYNSTISNNTAAGANSSGGGLSVGFAGLDMYNSIVTGNFAAGSPDIDSGPDLSVANIIGVNAGLLPLADHGGAVPTHAILTNSPALDAGDGCVLNLTCQTNPPAALTTDGRGAGFPRSVGATLDIGAYELNPREISVDNLTDNGSLSACTTALNDCSLRGAIARSTLTPDADIISFAVNGTITLTGGELAITNVGGGLTINGNGALPGFPKRTEITTTSGRIFNNSGILNLSGILMTNGLADGSSGGPNGGAIRNVGSLTIDRCAFSGNRADDPLNLSAGGALFNFSGGVTITNSTFSGNAARGDSGLGGAIYLQGGTVSLTNSAITGNIAGGTSASGGGGIAVNNGGTLNLTNTTINGNLAQPGAGSAGGGIYVLSGTVNIGNTILAGNSAPANPDGAGTINSGGFNLFGSTAGMSIGGTTTGNIVNPDARLLPLGFYGGPTLTVALAADSPAVNNGNAGSLTTDQRDAARVGTADIGAFEYNNAAVGGSFTATLPASTLLTPYSLQMVPENGAFSYSVTGGQLPSGISFAVNRAARISAASPSAAVSLGGTPAQSGFFNFNVTATNGIAAGTTDYGLQVIGPTAAGVTISGRVVTADGRGVANAAVVLTDGSGALLTARTGSFGTFKFESVAAGQTVVVEVRSKRFVFQPLVVVVSDEVSGLEFVAEEAR